MAQSPDERPATAAKLGDELQQNRRRNDLSVDNMALPTDTADEHRAEHSPVPSQDVGPAPSRVRIVLADDDVLLREGLASLLDRSGFEVVGQAGDSRHLLSLVREHRPDLIVVDIRMPPGHATEGLEAAHLIREESPEVAILVLSAYVEL